MGTPDPPYRRPGAGRRGYNVVAVVTTPDKPPDGARNCIRAKSSWPRRTGTSGIAARKAESARVRRAMQALKPDLGIVIAFRMLPEVIWAMPRLGTPTCIASPLPQYRGAAPINWAVINGETETGVTTFLLNHEIDKGAIIAVRVPTSSERQRGHDVRQTDAHRNGARDPDRGPHRRRDVQPMEQTESTSRLHPAPKIFKEDCRSTWSWEGRRIVNFVRGLSPYPAAWTEMRKGRNDIPTAKIYAAAFEAAASTTKRQEPSKPSATDAPLSAWHAPTGGSPRRVTQIAGKMRFRCASCSTAGDRTVPAFQK